MSEGLGDFWDVTTEELDKPKAGKLIFDSGELIKAVVEEFEINKEYGSFNMKCKVLEGPKESKSFYVNIKKDSPLKVDLLQCYWTRDQLLAGDHKKDGARSVIAGSKLKMKALEAREHKGKMYQSFVDFENVSSLNDVPF